MLDKLKEINWWRIAQVAGLFFFMAQLFAIIQLFIFQHYADEYNISSMIINFIIFALALNCVSNLIPKDFHVKNKETKNAK